MLHQTTIAQDMKRKQSKSPVVTPNTSAPVTPPENNIPAVRAKSRQNKKANLVIQIEESEISIEESESVVNAVEEAETVEEVEPVEELQEPVAVENGPKATSLSDAWRDIDLHYLYLDLKNAYWSLDDALAKFGPWNPSIGDCWINKESSEIVLAFRSEDAANSAKEKNPDCDDFVWINSLVENSPLSGGMKIFLNPILKKENCCAPSKQSVLESCEKHVALNLVVNRIVEVVILPEREAIMITFQGFDLHSEVENAVQDPINNGEKIMIVGRCYRITVAPIERPTDNTTYELYFGNFPGFARVLPIRTFLYTHLNVHMKYITCPPGRRGGRSNYMFIGLPL